MRVDKLIQGTGNLSYQLEGTHLNGVMINSTAALTHAQADAVIVSIKLREEGGTRHLVPRLTLTELNAIADLELGSFNMSRALSEVLGVADPDANDEIEINDLFRSYVALGSLYPIQGKEVVFEIENASGVELEVLSISKNKDPFVAIDYDRFNSTNRLYNQAQALWIIRAAIANNPNIEIEINNDSTDSTFNQLNVATQIFANSEVHNPLILKAYEAVNQLPEDVRIKHDGGVDDHKIIQATLIPYPKESQRVKQLIANDEDQKLSKVYAKNTPLTEYIREEETTVMLSSLK